MLGDTLLYKHTAESSLDFLDTRARLTLIIKHKGLQ